MSASMNRNAQAIGDVLLNEPTAYENKQFPTDSLNRGLSGTKKQLKVIKLACEYPDLSVDEVAELVHAHYTYVAEVLRRADEDFWVELFAPPKEDEDQEEWFERYSENYDKVEIPEVNDE